MATESAAVVRRFQRTLQRRSDKFQDLSSLRDRPFHGRYANAHQAGARDGYSESLVSSASYETLTELGVAPSTKPDEAKEAVPQPPAGPGRGSARPKSARARLEQSEVPARDHVYHASFVPPAPSAPPTGRRFEESDKHWHMRVFPSRQPSNRSEVLYLGKYFSERLRDVALPDDLDKQSADEQSSILQARREIYSLCFAEVLRQVRVHCTERGDLLNRLWTEFFDLVDLEREYSDQRHAKALNAVQGKLSDARAAAAATEEGLEARIAEQEGVIAKQEEEIKQLKHRLLLDKSSAKEAEIRRLQGEMQRLQGEVDRRGFLLNSVDRFCSILEARDDDESSAVKWAVLRRQMVVDRIRENQEAGPELRAALQRSLWEKDTELVERLVEDLPRLVSLLQDQAATVEQAEDQVDAERAQARALQTRVNEAELRLKLLDRESASKAVQTDVSGDDVAGDDEADGGAGAGDADGGPLSEEGSSGGVKRGRRRLRRKGKGAGVSGLPPMFAELFQSTAARGPGSKLSLRTLLRLINHIFAEKMVADDVDDREHNVRQPFAPFVYMFFLNKYGLRSLTEKHIVDLLAAARQNLRHPKVKMFGRFCGLVDPLSLPSLNFYLHTQSVVNQCNVGYVAAEADDGTIMVSLPRAQEVARIVFSKMDAARLADFLLELERAATTDSRNRAIRRQTGTGGMLLFQDAVSRVMQGSTDQGSPDSVRSRARRMSAIGPASPGRSPMGSRRGSMTGAASAGGGAGGAEGGAGVRGIVSAVTGAAGRGNRGSPELTLDRFLEMAIAEWEREHTRNTEQVLVYFKAGDIDGDKQLSYDEFRSLIKYIDPAVSDRQMLRIYTEELQDSGRETLDEATFLRLAKRLGLGAHLKPDPYRAAGLQERVLRPNEFLLLEEQWRGVSERVEAELKVLLKSVEPEARKAYGTLNDRTHAFMRALHDRADADQAWLSFRLLMLQVAELRKARMAGM